MSRLESAFKGRRIFVTGHTGFKGSWLTTWLLKLGAHVSGYSLLPNSTLFSSLKLEPQISHYIGDLRDPKQLKEVLAKEQPEMVIHMAAQALVREGYRDPGGTFSTNATGTLNLLDALKELSCCKAALFITTDKVYDPAFSHRPFCEEDPLKGEDPYSSSKVCAEQIIHTYSALKLIPGCLCAIARAGNVIGGGDAAKDRLLPDLLRAMDEKKALHIRYPRAIRPWQHVLDSLKGYLMLLAEISCENQERREKARGAWNFGPSEKGLSVEELIARAKAILQRPLEVVIEQASIQEAPLLRLDASKAKRQLGWTTQLSVDEALEWTFKWHEEARKDGDLRRFTEQQIADYMAREA